MRYICAITTVPNSGQSGDVVGYLDAEEVPQIGSPITITAQQDDGTARDVSGELFSIFEEGDLWW